MYFKTRTRRWLASWLSVALLLMQFTVATYACPDKFGVLNAKDAVNMTAMKDMPDCEAMGAQSDEARPLLCKAHCDQDKQSVNSTISPDLPSLHQVLSFVVAHVDYRLPEPSAGRFLTDRTGPPRGTPPVYLSLQVLRN